MARPWRPDLSHTFYHVMARGNNREALFIEHADRRFYTGILRKMLRQTAFELHAYCLMPNHIHLLMRTSNIALAKFMERLHGTYARWFNRQHGRIGHVFQDRFLAKAVTTERYLHHVGRYIHMNPVKAKLTVHPEEFEWSSMKTYLGTSRDDAVTVSALLAPYGGIATREFVQFTRACHVRGDQLGWPQGESWYVDAPTPQQEMACSDKTAALETVSKAAAVFQLTPKELLQARWTRRHAQARTLAALALRDTTMFSLAEIGRLIGLATAQAVSRSVKKARRRLNSNPWLRQRAADIDARITPLVG